MAALFYFLLIWPQQKARKETARLSTLKSGDEVILSPASTPPSIGLKKKSSG